MKYLFYYSTCFNQTFTGALLDQALYLSQDSNNKVAFAYCGGIKSLCDFNRKGSLPVCSVCKFFTKKILKKYGIDCIPLSDYISMDDRDNSSELLDYHNVNGLLTKEYRGVQVGMSIMSSYISITRNMYPLIDEESKVFFDTHLTQNVNLINAFYRLIEDYKPDEIWGYNGRYEGDRHVYDISKVCGIKFKLIEDVVRNGHSHRLIYDNNLPHNIKMRIARREYCWNNYKMTEEEKVTLGKSFYEKRRHGIFSGDKKIYIEDQNEGEIPLLNPNKKNIAIMNSSEDEFTAVGSEWDKLKLFKSQYEGIIYLLENAPKDIHFYLRIHPNLKDIKYSYHTRLLSLEDKYSNITVIPGNSTVSTYTLMERADAVVVFGSTMGIESSYWGKTSILLGPSFYYYDGVAYTPKTKKELIKLLDNIPKPLYNENVIKYGAYVLDLSPLYSEPHYLDWITHNDSFFGVDYYHANYFNLFISAHFTSFVMGCLKYILSFWGKCKLPLKEDTNW